MRCLHRWDMKLLHAATADEALQQFEANASRIDLLIADVHIPLGPSGVRVALQLRSSRPGLRVILTSGYPPSLWSDQGRRRREGALSGFRSHPEKAVSCGGSGELRRQTHWTGASGHTHRTLELSGAMDLALPWRIGSGSLDHGVRSSPAEEITGLHAPAGGPEHAERTRQHLGPRWGLQRPPGTGSRCTTDTKADCRGPQAAEN